MPIYRAWHIIGVQTSRNKGWIFFEVSTVKTATITEIVHAVPVFVGGGLVRETDGVLLDTLILLIFILENTWLSRSEIKNKKCPVNEGKIAKINICRKK